MVETAVEVRGNCGKRGINATVVNALFCLSAGYRMSGCTCRRVHQWIVTMEENVLKGGFGEACGDYILEKHEDIRLIHIGVPDVCVEHGGVDQLKKDPSYGCDSIVERSAWKWTENKEVSEFERQSLRGMDR